MELAKNFAWDKLAGLAFVFIVHGAVLYGLWSYKIIPVPDEAMTLMVNFISPPTPEQPKLPQPEPKPRQPSSVEPLPSLPQLVVQAPVVLPDEPVAPPPPLPEPVVMVSLPDTSPSNPPPSVVPQITLPSQPVMLTGELSVICPDRVAPHYPEMSKRINEQGKVVLRVELGEDGKVSNATIKTSSGFSRLDEAALVAVKTWRCNPLIRNTLAVRAIALQVFNFSLSD